MMGIRTLGGDRRELDDRMRFREADRSVGRDRTCSCLVKFVYEAHRLAPLEHRKFHVEVFCQPMALSQVSGLIVMRS